MLRQTKKIGVCGHYLSTDSNLNYEDTHAKYRKKPNKPSKVKSKQLEPFQISTNIPKM